MKPSKKLIRCLLWILWSPLFLTSIITGSAVFAACVVFQTIGLTMTLAWTPTSKWSREYGPIENYKTAIRNYKAAFLG